MGRPSGESATYLTIDDGRGKRIDVVRIFTSTPDSWQFGEGTPADVESGYWLLEANGSVHSFGDARHMGDAVLLGNAAAIVPTPSGRGYWCCRWLRVVYFPAAASGFFGLKILNSFLIGS